MLLSVSRRSRRASAVLTSLVALATVLTGAATTPAQAANRVTPGNFTGYGFDQCRTQSQEVMDAWLNSSPYLAVGVYIAGVDRFCGDDQQTELTPEWVSTQLAKGWRILPITVGPQASCSVRYKDKVRIRSNPLDDYAAAREQGRLEAIDTVQRAKALGIAAKSTLWYDLEHVSPSEITPRCRASALTFIDAWTDELHRAGYVSGFYSSASSWITELDRARVYLPEYTMPDRIWIAEWVTPERYRRPPTATPPSLLSSYISDAGWMPGRRMRQYRGGHDETYGGMRVNIDTNYLDLGRGTLGGKAPSLCGGTKVDFPRYRRLAFGSRGAQVKALQCLLKRRKLYDDRLTAFYNRGTTAAVRRFQENHLLRVNGRMWLGTWTALLSEGRSPVVKIGSGGTAVRRAQRSLNAAVGAGLVVDGVFGFDTTAATRTYQEAVGLRRTGVVDPTTWASLQAGAL